MKQQKLLASDLDGTIIFERAISAADAAAISRWQDAGHLAVCVTGKSLRATQHALSGFGVRFDYYVLYTGAVLTDADFRVLQEDHLPQQVVADVLHRLEGEPGIAVYATTLESPDLEVFSSVPPEVATDILQISQPICVAALLERTVIGIPIWVPQDPEHCTALLESLKAEFGEVLDVHQNQDFLDIVPRETNKGRGLTLLSEYLAEQGVSVESYSMGDSYNDLDMHAWADHATALPHSPLEVQQAAGQVSDSAAAFIEQILGDDAQ